MSNDPRTIREAGVGAHVVTRNKGQFVRVAEKLGDGWYRCETSDGEMIELHGTCWIKSRNQS